MIELPHIWHHYLEVRELVYSIPANKPYRHRRLTDDECGAIEDVLMHIATRRRRAGESIEHALAREVPDALEHWMRKRPGNKDYLKDLSHPLHELAAAADLDWLVTQRLTSGVPRSESSQPEEVWECCQAPRLQAHMRWCSAARASAA